MDSAIVSVIIPSYNHASFIKQAVQSVISQTLSALEIIIVDDGSTDGSQAIIEQIAKSDSRITTILLEKNVGAAEVLNIGIRRATSPYIAICNSDDEFVANKLELQLKILKETHVSAVFSDVFWIDESGKPTKPTTFSPDVFNSKNHSKLGWLKFLLEKGNCLCHPSILISRKVYDEVGFYDNRFRQLPDYDMWLRVTAKHQIFVMRDRLLKYRLLSGDGNTSSVNNDNSIRGANEHVQILSNAFRRITSDEFSEAFGTLKRLDDAQFNLAAEKVLYLITRDSELHVLFRNVGSTLLYELLETPEGRAAAAFYGLSDLKYQTVNSISALWFERTQPLSETQKLFLLDYAGEEQHFLLEQWCKSDATVHPKEQMKELERKYFKAEYQKKTAQDHAAELQKIADAKSEQNENLKTEHQTLQAKLQHLECEVSELRGVLNQIGNSSSWKITAPLRKIKGKTVNPKL